jgi:uncharacterized protein (TIGR02996 family)
MEEEAAFLRAIADAPEDDATRLVYADWLEERGDPRSAYVRVATRAAGRVRAGRPWDDLKASFGDACSAAPVEWRRQVGPWFDVVLRSTPPAHVIGVIVAIKELTDRRLAEIKEMVYRVPCVIQGNLPLDEAEHVRGRLEQAYSISPGSFQSEPACQVELRLSREAAEASRRGPRR